MIMKSRHRAREIAFQILYQFDFSGKDFISVEDLEVFFKHFQVPQVLKKFITQLVMGTSQNLKEVDKNLEKHLVDWKMSRISPVDRSVLRLAVFEMLYLNQTSHVVVMNEAIELAKTFGTEETPGFVNGVLDNVFHKKEKVE